MSNPVFTKGTACVHLELKLISHLWSLLVFPASTANKTNFPQNSEHYPQFNDQENLLHSLFTYSTSWWPQSWCTFSINSTVILLLIWRLRWWFLLCVNGVLLSFLPTLKTHVRCAEGEVFESKWSLMLQLTWVNGMEFKIAPASAKTVRKSEKVIFWLPGTISRLFSAVIIGWEVKTYF